MPGSARLAGPHVRLTGAIVLALLVLSATPIGARVGVGAIHAYQYTLGPLLGRAGFRCRFTPTCSHYAEVVIARDGLLVGALESARRIARCNPWTPAGTVDLP